MATFIADSHTFLLLILELPSFHLLGHDCGSQCADVNVKKYAHLFQH